MRREHSPKAGARKIDEHLVLQVVTERSDLPPKADVHALRERARQDLHGALINVATARRLPPPPPLPGRIRMYAKGVAGTGRQLAPAESPLVTEGHAPGALAPDQRRL